MIINVFIRKIVRFQRSHMSFLDSKLTSKLKFTSALFTEACNLKVTEQVVNLIRCKFDSSQFCINVDDRAFS